MTLTTEPPGTTSAPAPATRVGGAPPTAPASQPRSLSRSASLLVVVLVMVASLAAWLVAYLFGFSALQEQHDQHVMYSHFREQLALGVAPPFGVGTKLRDGEPVALINAPVPGLQGTVVVEGTSAGDLENGPGHLPGTVLPGESGVSTLMGRSVAFAAPFRNITRLAPGSTFTVTTGQGVFHYKVVDVRGPGAPIPGVLGTAASRLTLVTSADGGWHDLWVPTHAVYVDAVLVGKARPVAAGTVPTLADGVMASDKAALVPLVLWLQALFVVAVGLVWLRSRWSPLAAWVVGTPMVIALLWGASSELVRLLPNLF
jgi:sortase A